MQIVNCLFVYYAVCRYPVNTVYIPLYTVIFTHYPLTLKTARHKIVYRQKIFKLSFCAANSRQDGFLF